MPPPADSTANTPLAPSVEKAYYRKCIELKRRLNEVEAANDEAKLRRVRLERGIMKMRLERAFLLDELRKRMEENVDDSEGSGEEMMATPPVDRPHRDKRRRHNPPQQQQQPGPSAAPSIPRRPSDPQHMKREFAAQPETLPSQPHGAPYMPPRDHAPPPPPQQALPSNAYGQSSPYAAQQTPQPATAAPHSHERPNTGPSTHANDMDGAAERDGQATSAVSRHAGATGETLSSGPAVREGANGERRVASSESIGDGGS